MPIHPETDPGFVQLRHYNSSKVTIERADKHENTIAEFPLYYHDVREVISLLKQFMEQHEEMMVSGFKKAIENKKLTSQEMTTAMDAVELLRSRNDK